MIFESTAIRGCKSVELKQIEDPRGFFARTWCGREFAGAGLPDRMVQSSLSYNRKAGTLRGMHFQLPPSNEGKLVRCIRGAVFDAVVDLRAGSGTYLEKVAVRLDDKRRNALYVPPGCAHGFQTLEDDSEVLYMMTDVYQPDLGAGFRWNDPAFDIAWPIADPILHKRDAEYADFDEAVVRSWSWNRAID